MRCLDLAMNDGWMLANLWTGQKEMKVKFSDLSGMDLNQGAVDRALERQKKYGWTGSLVCDDAEKAANYFVPHSFDVVCAFEVIEHVPDPQKLLDIMDLMCAFDGRCFLSTPDGAFEHGQLDQWWVVESKGHLRALTPGNLSALVQEHGVMEALELEQGLIACSYRPRRPKGKVIFYAGNVSAAPEKILSEGLGGSETALCKVAEQFARRGYDVRVYAGTSETGLRGDHITVGEPVLEGGSVLYGLATEWDPGEPCDLFVSVRVPEAFDRTIAAPQRVLWLHDADYGERLTEKQVDRATYVIVLSDFQRELLTGMYPFIKGKVLISRNGIELTLFNSEEQERKPWVVYSSSPDRGLDVLLECWPQIKERVPEAELHHTYAPVYHEFRQVYEHLARFHQHLEKLQEGLEGVVSHRSMGQGELAKLYCQSRCWAYPSWTTPSNAKFPEISCISAMEAQAAGAWPVCLDYGALQETVLHGSLVSGEPPEEKWREKFIDAVVDALVNYDDRQGELEDNRKHALELSWAGVVDDWEAAFLSDIAAPNGSD